MQHVKPRIGAIVLAAGPSSRLGRAKQLLKISGQSLVRRAAHAALEGGCWPVVVVTGSRAARVAGELGGLDIVVSGNRHWANGMGTSLRHGLATLLTKSPDVEAAVLLVCDQPNLDGAVVAKLVELWRKSGKPMAACKYAGTLGTPCCFAASLFSLLKALPDDAGAKPLLTKHADQVQVMPWENGRWDIDTPEDLHKFGSSGR